MFPSAALTTSRYLKHSTFCKFSSFKLTLWLTYLSPLLNFISFIFINSQVSPFILASKLGHHFLQFPHLRCVFSKQQLAYLTYTPFQQTAKSPISPRPSHNLPHHTSHDSITPLPQSHPHLPLLTLLSSYLHTGLTLSWQKLLTASGSFSPTFILILCFLQIQKRPNANASLSLKCYSHRIFKVDTWFTYPLPLWYSPVWCFVHNMPIKLNKCTQQTDL